MTLDEVREKLKPMNVSFVSRQTGVHKNAIYRLMKGTTEPKYETVQKIINWLDGVK